MLDDLYCGNSPVADSGNIQAAVYIFIQAYLQSHIGYRRPCGHFGDHLLQLLSAAFSFFLYHDRHLVGSVSAYQTIGEGNFQNICYVFQHLVSAVLSVNSIDQLKILHIRHEHIISSLRMFS